MPSTTLKRTAATLGVLAGLLATAGPASAMPIHMPILERRWQPWQARSSAAR